MLDLTEPLKGHWGREGFDGWGGKDALHKKKKKRVINSVKKLVIGPIHDFNVSERHLKRWLSVRQLGRKKYSDLVVLMLQKCNFSPPFFHVPLGHHWQWKWQHASCSKTPQTRTAKTFRCNPPHLYKTKKHADHFVLCEHMFYLALFLCSAMVLAPETNNIEWEDNHLQLSVIIIPLRLCETTGSQCRQSVLDH